MDIYEANSIAWDEEVRRRNFWSRQVSDSSIDKAKEGRPDVWITPFRMVPQDWLDPIRGKKVLNLCGGGGQQTPVLAAYGCDVTTVDNSASQIEQDKLALEKHGLKAKLIKENVLDIAFSDHSFDYVVMPQALNFIDDIMGLYRLVRRLIADGGHFMFGIANPILYAFDDMVQERRLRIKYTIPFADTVSLSRKELERRLAKKDTVEFSHTLESILGGLVESGFVMDGFYTDECGSELTDSFVHDSHLAIRAKAI
ncbi:MAG: class I SAM-dependent methyltransferase [Spirochaetales bacterium]|nr:class I SAM-dependent methyltransferase [Spirochaetales bacterium]